MAGEPPRADFMSRPRPLQRHETPAGAPEGGRGFKRHLQLFPSRLRNAHANTHAHTRVHTIARRHVCLRMCAHGCHHVVCAHAWSRCVHTRVLTCTHVHTHPESRVPPGQGPPTPATGPRWSGRTFRLPRPPSLGAAPASPDTRGLAASLADCCSPVIWSKKLTSVGRSPTWPQLRLEAGLADKLVLERGGGGESKRGPRGKNSNSFFC